MAEAGDLKSLQCGFESHRGYEKGDPIGVALFVSWVGEIYARAPAGGVTNAQRL